MGMTEVWNFQDEALARIDLRGFAVHARDGAIGQVVQAVEGAQGGFMVVDPGVAMPLGRQLLVPAGLVEQVDVEERRVSVRADREQIKNAPEYAAGQPLDERSRSVFGDYFRSLLGELTGRTQRPSPNRTRKTRQAQPRARRTRAAAPSRQARKRPGRSDEATKEELYEQAKKLDIEGRSKMNKPELARAVGRRRGQRDRRSSTGAKANPVEVQAFLQGVGYPTEKRQLLREAESRRASREVRATLRQLPQKKFKSPTEVSKAIGKLK